MSQGQRRFRLAPLLLVCSVALAGCNASFWASSPQPQPIGPGCPAWTAPTTTTAIAPPTATDPLALEAYNAQLVSQTQRPVRNLYTLTQRLVNHQSGHIACQATTTPATEQVGDERQFWVINASQSGYHRISARLDYVTPNLYVYVQDDATVDYLALKASADRFEAQIYPRDRAAFGDQWSLGPDHESRITLLNATNLGPVGGYFSSEDEYPTTINPYSNARQMIYLNLSGGARPGSAYYDATLAHEFQHMIHWWARPTDPSWMNEGMSVLAQQLNSLTTDGLERAYFSAPQTPLVSGWTDDPRANVPRYGAGYAFMEYFFEHYGGDKALRALMASKAQAPQAFDQALARLGSHDRFNDVYAKFLVANLLNDPSIAHGTYSYRAFPGERAHSAASVSSYPYATTSGSLAQYGAAYYDFRAPSTIGDSPLTLNVDFSGAPTTTIIPNTLPSASPTEWWSNSGDNMDSTLTRTVDLSSVMTGPIQMTFDAWYNLESGFDYTYVEASADGGATWSSLPVTNATTANPNGDNLGYGLTGVSGGAQPQWTPESVDLSAYAGTKLQLRFETVTDDAVHNAGFALDSVSIPAIGYSSDAPTDSGWVSNGWMRTSNTLPQLWSIQSVMYYPGAKAPVVQRLIVDATSGQAAATFLSFGGEVSHVALIVSPIAPTTYTLAPYQISASVG